MEWTRSHVHTSPGVPGSASWVTEADLRLLNGGHDLVIIRAGRFRDVPTLLRAWATTSVRSGELAGGIVRPAPGTADSDYWAHVASSLRDSSVPNTRDGSARFHLLLDTVAEQDSPVVLVLDDIHLVSDPSTRIRELFARAAPGCLRVVVTDRLAQIGHETWDDLRVRVVGADQLTLDAHAVADMFDDADVRHHSRTPHLVAGATGGLPALAAAVLASVPTDRFLRPRELGPELDDVVRSAIESTIRDDEHLLALRGELLLLAAADVIDTRAVELLPRPDLRGHRVLNILASGGLTEAVSVDDTSEWRLPPVVRSALLRSAAIECPEVLHSYRSSLIDDREERNRLHAAALIAAEDGRWEYLNQLFRQNIDVFYAGGLAATIADPVLLSAPTTDVDLDPVVKRLVHLHDRLAGPRDRLVLPPVPLPGSAAEPPAGATDVDQGRLSTFLLALELRAAGRFDDAARLCDDLVSGPAPDPATLTPAARDARAFSFLHSGMCFLMVGRFDDALAALRSCTRIAVGDFIRRDCAGKLALTLALIGNVDEARSWSDEERSYPLLAEDTEQVVRPAGDVAAALIDLNHLRVDRAVQTLRELGRPTDSEELWGFILYAWGRVGLVTGSPDITLRSLNGELWRFTTMRDHGAVVGPLLDAVRADLHLAAGRPHDAAELVSESRHHATAPVRSRLLLLTGEPQAALTLARRALADPLATHVEGLELCLVAAAASLAAGDIDSASEFVSTAVGAHSTTSLRLALRCLPGQVTRRLTSLSALLPSDPGVLGPEFGTLEFPTSVRRPGRDSPLPKATPVPRPETLTDRELVVLRCLPSDATVRQIADLHFVSVNTVKSQLRSVYKKLAVGSREDAVAAAAAFDLL